MNGHQFSRRNFIRVGWVFIVLLACTSTVPVFFSATAPPASTSPALVNQPSTAPHSPRASTAPKPSPQPAIPPIYVTMALHIENLRAYANCRTYPDYREKLLQFAKVVAPYHPAVNLQTDYEFLMGVSRCETTEMQASTQGMNVLEYLASRYGYEIDPHQEGGWDVGRPDNYADIRYLAGQLTSAASETIGGLVWDDPEQWNTLAQGERGLQHPNFVWFPKILTLAVSSRHRQGDFTDDDFTSGVWRPKGAGARAFWTHDPQGPLIYIGPGEYDNWGGGGKWGRRSTPEFVRYLLDQLEADVLPREAIYTATLAVPQHIIFDPQRHAKLVALLEELAPLVASGRVVYATYSQVAVLWEQEYGARPNIYRSSEP